MGLIIYHLYSSDDYSIAILLRIEGRQTGYTVVTWPGSMQLTHFTLVNIYVLISGRLLSYSLHTMMAMFVDHMELIMDQWEGIDNAIYMIYLWGKKVYVVSTRAYGCGVRNWERCLPITPWQWWKCMWTHNNCSPIIWSDHMLDHC